MKYLSKLSATFAVGTLVALSACAMPNDHAGNSRTNVASSQPVSPVMVQQVQVRLQQLGMYQSTVDGIWGPATEASVRIYQKSQGMGVSGQLDSPTLAAMNLDGSNPSPLAANQTPTQPNAPR